jgi:hypothetical protein
MKNIPDQTIYKRVQHFANFTKTLIINGDIRNAKRCLLAAEKMFNRGNDRIKNAISNVYVFSLSSFMEMHHCNIKDLFPKTLVNEYRKQVTAFGV